MLRLSRNVSKYKVGVTVFDVMPLSVCLLSFIVLTLCRWAIIRVGCDIWWTGAIHTAGRMHRQMVTMHTAVRVQFRTGPALYTWWQRLYTRPACPLWICTRLDT